MPFPKKSSAAESLLPVDPIAAQLSIETRLTEARASLAEQTRKLGATVLAGAEADAMSSARADLASAKDHLQSLEAGLGAAQDLEAERAEAERAEAVVAAERAVQDATRRLQAAAHALDEALPTIAPLFAELAESEERLTALAGRYSPIGWQVAAAQRNLSGALAWHLRVPQVSASLSHNGGNFCVKLPGNRRILTVDEARLAQHYPEPQVTVD